METHEHERYCEYHPFTDDNKWELAKFLVQNLNTTVPGLSVHKITMGLFTSLTVSINSSCRNSLTPIQSCLLQIDFLVGWATFKDVVTTSVRSIIISLYVL